MKRLSFLFLALLQAALASFPNQGGGKISPLSSPLFAVTQQHFKIHHCVMGRKCLAKILHQPEGWSFFKIWLGSDPCFHGTKTTKLGGGGNILPIKEVIELLPPKKFHEK